MIIKFTDSVMTAIEAVAKLLEGKYENEDYPIPSWNGFIFFNEIHASKVEKMLYTESTFCFERTVDFFHNEKVLRVYLIGYTCNPRGIHPVWVTEKIEYCTPYILPLGPGHHQCIVEEHEEERAKCRWYTVYIRDCEEWWKFCEENR